jgi:FMN-binding domain
MRRISLWFIATVAVVVLLFSYRTSRGAAVSAHADSSQPAAQPGGATPASGATPTSGATPGGGTGAAVVNGTVVQTRWGPVQVRVTISGGRIADVTALQVPDSNPRDQEINSFAVPRLRQEVLAAQTAHIDTVSGATVTSDGYLTSLQAALDAAHFAG